MDHDHGLLTCPAVGDVEFAFPRQFRDDGLGLNRGGCCCSESGSNHEASLHLQTSTAVAILYLTSRTIIIRLREVVPSLRLSPRPLKDLDKPVAVRLRLLG